MVELEPCPFCGAYGAFVRDDCPTMWVECRFCGAHGPFGCGELRAAEAWNVRADDILRRADVTRGPGKVVSKCERDTRVPYRLGTDHYCEFEVDDEYVYFGDMVEVFWDAYDGERSCVGRLCSVDYGEDGFICGAFLRDEDDDALFVPCDGVFYKPEKGAER